MQFSGYHITREYYINDAGSQITTLSQSAFIRYREVLGEALEAIPAGLYPGDYLIEVGQYLADNYGDSLKQLLEDEIIEKIGPIAVDLMMQSIRKDLARLGIVMDIYSSENQLVKEILQEIDGRARSCQRCHPSHSSRCYSPAPKYPGRSYIQLPAVYV